MSYSTDEHAEANRRRNEANRETLEILRELADIVGQLQTRKKLRRTARRRRWWVRGWLARRELHGQYDNLLHELNREDPGEYKRFLRVDADFFGYVLERVTPYIEKQDTRWRPALKPGNLLYFLYLLAKHFLFFLIQ